MGQVKINLEEGLPPNRVGIQTRKKTKKESKMKKKRKDFRIFWLSK